MARASNNAFAKGITVTTSLEYAFIIVIDNPIGPLLCLLFADPESRVNGKSVWGAVGIGVFSMLFARSIVPPALIALGVAVTLCNDLLSYSFHNYQSELFPTRPYRKEDAALLHTAFEDVLLSAPRPAESETVVPPPEPHTPEPARSRPVFDLETGEFIEVAIHGRKDLRPGALIPGPAIIVEDETSTVVNRLFEARINAFGYIELTRR